MTSEGDADHVAAREDDGEALLLDRRRLHDPHALPHQASGYRDWAKGGVGLTARRWRMGSGNFISAKVRRGGGMESPSARIPAFFLYASFRSSVQSSVYLQ